MIQNDKVTFAEIEEQNREREGCNRCPQCHPGKQWGGIEACRIGRCECHSIRTDVR